MECLANAKPAQLVSSPKSKRCAKSVLAALEVPTASCQAGVTLWISVSPN